MLTIVHTDSIQLKIILHIMQLLNSVSFLILISIFLSSLSFATVLCCIDHCSLFHMQNVAWFFSSWYLHSSLQYENFLLTDFLSYQPNSCMIKVWPSDLRVLPWDRSAIWSRLEYIMLINILLLFYSGYLPCHCYYSHTSLAIVLKLCSS